MRVFAIAALAALLYAAAPFACLADTYDPTSLTAAQIFNKCAAAFGTRQPGNYQKVEQTHTGGVDWTSTTLTDGENYVTRVDGGGFTTAEGIYQKQSWTQDENGIVLLRNDFHDKEDPNELAFEHPDDPKYNVHVLGITQDAPRQYVVELNPPGGYDEYLYYDATSFLLVRDVSFTRDRYRHVTDYSDYRKVYGETMAFRTHSYDGRPENDTVTTINSYQKFDTPLDLAIPSSKPIVSYAGSTPVDLPVRFTQENGIVIRAVIDGKGFDFVLDSGASGLMIDPSVARELGLTPFGKSSETVGGGDIDMGKVRIPHMSIGPLSLDNVVFTTGPMDSRAEGARVVGLMGFDLLASGVFGIDFKTQKVTYYPPGSFDPKMQGLIPLALDLDDSVPRTAVVVEGVLGHFLVDTGSFQLLVYKDFSKRLPSVTTLADGADITTVGGTMPTSIVGLNDLIFGRVRYRTVQAILPSISTFDQQSYDGIIGRDVLAGYQSFFDYADGTLFVKPNF